jgi:spore coat protein CotH
MGSRNVWIIVTSDSISRFIPTFIPTVFVLLAVVLDPALARGQTAADLFNPDVVQEIRLSINSRDLRELHQRYQENTYYTADLSWQVQRLGQPAPRESYCRLYINNVFEGLYSIVESIDTPFLARVYGSDQGMGTLDRREP